MKAFNGLDEAHPPMEDNLLSSNSTDLNTNLRLKSTFTETSRILSGQISGSCSLAKLTYKFNHHNGVRESYSKCDAGINNYPYGKKIRSPLPSLQKLILDELKT